MICNIETFDPENPEHQSLVTYDHTKLSAYNTCPTWGVVRYGLHLTAAGTDRAMALEAGEVMHQVFAAFRIWWLGVKQNETELARQIAEQQFGKERTDQTYAAMSPTNTEQTNALNFCLTVLNTSGFYDDPRDKRRTLSNLTDATIVYVNYMLRYGKDIWISEDRQQVGIEVPFNLVVSIGSDTKFRFTGKIDGIHVDKHGNIVIEENKTGARIDDAWLAQWRMSHQITGYCVAVSAIVKQEVTSAYVIGLAIPVPRTGEIDGIRSEYVPRDDTKRNTWMYWIDQTVSRFTTDLQTPRHALRYTHSCNRYFRPCSLMLLCDSTEDEWDDIISTLNHDEWSPLEEKSRD